MSHVNRQWSINVFTSPAARAGLVIRGSQYVSLLPSPPLLPIAYAVPPPSTLAYRPCSAGPRGRRGPFNNPGASYVYFSLQLD
jgi:hypothetical protein